MYFGVFQPKIALTYFTYFGLFVRWEPSTMVLHSCLFVAIFSISFPVYLIFFLSFSVSLCRVLLGLPLFIVPWGFLASDCRVMFVAGFLNVCPIHLHYLFFISFFTGSCLVISHSVVLDTLSDHFRGNILRWHLLMNVCIFFSV